MSGHSAKPLPSARNPTLGKVNIAVGYFAECLLPSVTLGKDFAEWNLSFAECNGHSAKFGSPVVFAMPLCKENLP